MSIRRLTLGLLLALAAAPAQLLYVGTYTGPNSKGIYAYRFDASTGTGTPLGVVGATPNPSFVAISPNRQFLYAANEINNYKGQKSGSVTAFRIDASTGKLTELNSVSSHGTGPCYVTVDHTGKNVLVANYNGGTVAVLPVAPDGSLKEASSFIQHTGSSVNKSRQAGPHAHTIVLSPDNKYAVAADLGTDKLIVYSFDAAKGTLEPHSTASVEPGSGPRHIAFQPGGKHAYSINEMKSTIMAFDWDGKTGTLTQKQTISTLPAEFHGETSTAEIEVGPNGKFLFGSNRGHNSVAVYAIAGDGKLKLVEIADAHVKIPRSFTIDPSGRYLLAAGQDSNTIAVHKLDPKTGHLTFTGTTWDVGSPVCLVFLPPR